MNLHLKKLDIKFGDLNEKNTKSIIENWLGIELESYEDKYSTFDYYNTEKKIVVELKSRRNGIKKYDTQLIGYNKLEKAHTKLLNGYIVYFFWLLTDGLYCYKVDINHKFKRVFLGNYARNDKSKELCLIPNMFLRKTKPRVEETDEPKPYEPIVVEF